MIDNVLLQNINFFKKFLQYFWSISRSVFVNKQLHKYLGTLNPLNAKLTKWPNTLKQFVGNLPTNCLSVFGHFLGLALKGLIPFFLLTLKKLKITCALA